MTDKEKKEVQEETKTDMVEEPILVEEHDVESEDNGLNVLDVDETDEVDVEEVEVNKNKIELTEKERELALYQLACDVANMRVNQLEADSYANTVNEMGENNDRIDSDGVRRSTQYYVEKHFQFKWHSLAQQIQLNRIMIERGITPDELNNFMNKTMNKPKD